MLCISDYPVRGSLYHSLFDIFQYTSYQFSFIPCILHTFKIQSQIIFTFRLMNQEWNPKILNWLCHKRTSHGRKPLKPLKITEMTSSTPLWYVVTLFVWTLHLCAWSSCAFFLEFWNSVLEYNFNLFCTFYYYSTAAYLKLLLWLDWLLQTMMTQFFPQQIDIWRSVLYLSQICLS